LDINLAFFVEVMVAINVTDNPKANGRLFLWLRTNSSLLCYPWSLQNVGLAVQLRFFLTNLKITYIYREDNGYADRLVSFGANNK